MNLLKVLLESMFAEEAVKSLSKVTGLSSSQLKKIIPLAVPLLLRYLTSNASSKDGADSLLKALSDHTDESSLADQILNADEKDGEKIIGHILGLDSSSAISKLSKKSGLSSSDTKKLLAMIAPALLSSLSAAVKPKKKTAKKTDDDLSSLLSLLTGGKKSSSKSSEEKGLEWLGSMLAESYDKDEKKKTTKKTTKKTASSKAEDKLSEELLKGLLGTEEKKKSRKSDADVTALIGSLLGEAAGGKDTTEDMLDGKELISLLKKLS